MSKIIVTGGAGFIGTNLIRHLLATTNYEVVCIDNFSTGFHSNLTEVFEHPRLKIIEQDLAVPMGMPWLKGAIGVVHLAAMGSVPRSFKDPLTTHAANTTAFLRILTQSLSANVGRFVYASSSSVYGDSPTLPKVESHLGMLLSPYAVTKKVNEEYARLLVGSSNASAIGLRFFNVFGPWQSPQGAYAAAIPRFIEAAKAGEHIPIYGNGEQTRDFTYVDNVVQAIVSSLLVEMETGSHHVLNIGCGERITILETAQILANSAAKGAQIVHLPERPGDIRHSLADITAAKNLIDYSPAITVRQGLELTLNGGKTGNPNLLT
jgi:UDP-N-acetylglucosamine/UDP-N-acetylgalactosamine 4-epimerase